MKGGPPGLGAAALAAALASAPCECALLGQADFASCTAGPVPARCGWVRVPEDRADPNGRTLRLRVVVAPAPDSARLPDPVFLLLGGPGDAAASRSDAFAGPLRGLFPTRDLVFVDQRGTGASNGLFCPGDRASGTEDPSALFGSLFPVSEVEACRKRLEPRADLRRYLTPDAADDLATIMDGLGYREANLLALSYGTRVAQVFARRHPDRTRTLVLSGVMSFDLRAPLFYARDAQRALGRVLEACRAQAGCRNAYPRLLQDVNTVWSRLDAGPVEVEHARSVGESSVTVRLSKGDVGYAVRSMLYTPEGQEAIPGAFAAAAEGDWSTFVQRYLTRRNRSFATGMHLSVLCGEEVRRLTDGDIEAASAGTFLGRHVADDMREACAHWPAGPLPPGFHDPFVTDLPLLLLSGEFDPVTPPVWADGVATANPNAHHVVVPGGGHGITAVRGGLGCLGGIVAAFVSTGGARAPARDCLAHTPPPAFKD